MVDYNPYVYNWVGLYNPLYKTTNQGFFHCSFQVLIMAYYNPQYNCFVFHSAPLFSQGFSLVTARMGRMGLIHGIRLK